MTLIFALRKKIIPDLAVVAVLSLVAVHRQCMSSTTILQRTIPFFIDCAPVSS